MAERVISRKQSALLSRKKFLLNEIKCYEFKINEESLASNNNLICDDSSDSECEFTVEVGLSVTELKLKQRSLKTCLQATQELTGVTVLQSEVNVLVQDPVFEGKRPISEEGVWREITAECRIDLVPFSINYYVHKPSRMFGPISYRNLHVTPVKASHEVELGKSILKTTRQPSDAIEIIRNYSAAHRSRRTTLARLAEKYGEALFMVPMPEGGYRLKCAELMEVQWSLQNKWSPLAPFHHRMVFDLEFMDESYIKTISTLHKQIIDPTIDTDDRTLLLAKIINTCLEAKAHTTQNQAEESVESESEAAEKLQRRRTTLDQEPQEPERNRKKDSEVMAPPKSLPKKTKPKGKENTTDNKAKPVKRVADDVGEKESAKKAKTTAADKLIGKNTENKTNNTKTKPDKVNKGNNENSGGNDDDGNPKKAKTTATDKLIETKNTEIKTKNIKTKPDKVNKDNENSGGNDDDANVITSDINQKKAKTSATDKLIETKNTEIKMKNTKTDKVNKDNNANNGGKFDDANVITSDIYQKKAKTTVTDKLIETKNTESKTKSTKTKTDKTNKDNNANIGEKIDDKNVIMSDKNPKNSEKISRKSKIKHSDMAYDQPVTTDRVQINNVKESKPEKGKNTVKDSKQQKTQKLDNKANIVTKSTQINKGLNKEKETVQDNSEPNFQRKSSANVIKSIKAKQKDILLKSKELKSSKDSVTQKFTKDMKIKAPETISKKSIGNINKQNINKPKLALATKTNKEKSKDTALPNLIKNSKDVSKKATTANYLKNSFLPKAANKIKSALPTKIPRISPRKLSSIKSNIQDISKSSRTSQMSLQKTTNIPRLLKKPQIFKNKV